MTKNDKKISYIHKLSAMSCLLYEKSGNLARALRFKYDTTDAEKAINSTIDSMSDAIVEYIDSVESNSPAYTDICTEVSRLLNGPVTVKHTDVNFVNFIRDGLNKRVYIEPALLLCAITMCNWGDTSYYLASKKLMEKVKEQLMCE